MKIDPFDHMLQESRHLREKLLELQSEVWLAIRDLEFGQEVDALRRLKEAIQSDTWDKLGDRETTTDPA